MSKDYNPDSLDSVLTKLFERMDTQDAMLQEIREGVKTTNGRVNVLETKVAVLEERSPGRQGGIAGTVSGVIAGFLAGFVKQ